MNNKTTKTLLSGIIASKLQDTHRKLSNAYFAKLNHRPHSEHLEEIYLSVNEEMIGLINLAENLHNRNIIDKPMGYIDSRFVNKHYY